MFKTIVSELVSGRRLFFWLQYNRVSPRKSFDWWVWAGGRGETRAPPNNEILDIFVILHNLSIRSVI